MMNLLIRNSGCWTLPSGTRVIICGFTGWGGYFVQKLLVIKHGILLTEHWIYKSPWGTVNSSAFTFWQKLWIQIFSCHIKKRGLCPESCRSCPPELVTCWYNAVPQGKQKAPLRGKKPQPRTKTAPPITKTNPQTKKGQWWCDRKNLCLNS